MEDISIELYEKISRLKERNNILRQTLNYYANGSHYMQNHRGEISLVDSGEYAHHAILQEHIIAVADSGYDTELNDALLTGKISAPPEILEAIKSNLKRADTL